LEEVIELKEQLKNWKEKNITATLTILSRLNSAQLTRDLLKRSKIGLFVKKISKQ